MFGLIDGAAIFNLNKLRASEYVPKVVLTNISIDSETHYSSVTELDTLVLTENQRNIRLSFSVTTTIAPRHLTMLTDLARSFSREYKWNKLQTYLDKQ